MPSMTPDQLLNAIVAELAGICTLNERGPAFFVADGRLVVNTPGLSQEQALAASVDGLGLLRELLRLRRLGEEADAAKLN